MERTVRHLLEKYRRAGGDGARVREAGTKKDYVLPLFRSLGWDVENRAEVTAEERVSRGFVDYGFRADNMPMFYRASQRLCGKIDPWWTKIDPHH